MNKKIKGVFAAAVILSALFVVFSYGEEELEERGNFRIRQIENCGLEKFYGEEFNTEEQCEPWKAVVGFGYEFTLKEEREEGTIEKVFPIESLSESNVFSTGEIFCDNRDAIGVAKFNKETKMWALLDSSYVIKLNSAGVEAAEGEQVSSYKVRAKISGVGIYAVIKKDNSFLDSASQLGSGEAQCGARQCGIFRGFETSPDPRGYVKEGESITLDFCRIIPGCDATANPGTLQARACPQGANPQNPLCTNTEETDCCIPKSDGVCDKDCWRVDQEGEAITDTLEAGQVVADSTDPDCLKGDGFELYKPYAGNGLGGQDEEDPKEEKIQKEVSTPAFAQEPFFNIYDPPILLEGSVFIDVEDGSKGVWIANFTYTDLLGNEHMLMPIRPSIKGIGYPERDKMVLEPYLLYQAEGEKGEFAEQFDLPPTGVKKISFFAKKDENAQKSKFTIIMTKHELEDGADPDGDNYTNFEDCHDSNKFIYPGAQEQCNGIDDNCNSYNYYNHSDDILGFSVREFIPAENCEGAECRTARGTLSYISPEDSYDRTGKLLWGAHHRDTCGGSERCNYVMPCDGYLEFKAISDSVYFEVWRKDATYLCQCGEKTCGAEDEAKYTGRPISCDAIGGNGVWNVSQAIFGRGGDECNGEEETLMSNYAFGGADYNYGEWTAESNAQVPDSKGCAIGAHASCRNGAFPFTPSGNSIGGGDGGVWEAFNRFGDYSSSSGYDEDNSDVSQLRLDLLNRPINRVELKEGEMLWAITYGHDDCAGIPGTQYGDVYFNIYCYNKYTLQDVPGEPLRYVDEDANCAEKPPIEVHVCPESKHPEDEEVFDTELKACIEGDICTSFTTTTESTTNTDGGDCVYQTTAEDKPGIKPFHAYACRGDSCFKFYSGSFKVCAEKEVCLQGTSEFRNDDLDCDGLAPFELTDGKIDRTKPLDPDCAGVSLAGDCDFVNKKWYKSESEGYVEEGYCQVCGDRDSSCTKLCEADEKSCDGGCREDACDIDANKWCRAGAWTEEGYAAKCGLKDVDFFTEAGRDCSGNACDLVYNKTCYSSAWSALRRDAPYCDTPTCRPVDFDCRASCTPGSCDVHANAYCKADSTWSAGNADDYCSECGAIDSDCGGKACAENYCDTNAHKVCLASGEWEGEQLKYCEKCSPSDIYYCNPECPPEEEQTLTEEGLCADGADNDCDGNADCMDTEDCSSLSECAERCAPGATDSCGLDEGLCAPGTHTCGYGGRWGACEGGALPQPEVCNGFDDDCTGAPDEGCDCTNGETRACGRDAGSCSSGTQRCADGKWGICFRSSRARPAEEICDTLDNDCDGEVDEGCPCIDGAAQSCGIREGICVNGTQTCSSGEWGSCVGEKGKMTENTNTAGTCSDNLDNDCDTKKDAEDDGCAVTRTEDLAPSCTDQKKNQDEQDIDCGGSCPPCVSPANCNNRVMDPGEDGLDCGGDCSVQCTEKTRVRTGPSDELEEETTAEPECGDYICDEGEDESCSEDCKEEAEGISLTTYLLPVIIVLGVIALGYFAYKKGLIKVKGKKPEKAAPSFPAPKGVKEEVKASPFKPPQYAPQKAASSRKELKTREELELEKSLKEQKELLKK